MPKRIQRKSVKGWKMPENTVSVCRPGKWGNPFKVGGPHPESGRAMSAQEAVDCFSEWIPLAHRSKHLDLSELRGKNLACFCKIGEPCHADVLIELANEPKENMDAE